MNISKHCSWRTFWVGYRDWLRSRLSMTHAEALQEARDDFGSRLSRKAIGTFLGIATAFFALVALVITLTPTLVRGAVSAGATSEHVAGASQWGTVLILGSIAGYFIVSKTLRIRRFCFEMCARGQEIEAALANKQQ